MKLIQGRNAKKTCTGQDEKLNLKNGVDKSHPSTPVWWVTAPASITLPTCFGPFEPLPGITLIQVVVYRRSLQQFVKHPFLFCYKRLC